MIMRYFSSASLGLLVAAGLLWLMQYLIDIGPAVIVDDPPIFELAWLAARTPEVIEDDADPPERLPPPVQPPSSRPPVDGDELPSIGLPTTSGPEHPQPAWEPQGIVLTDGPLVVLMNVQPVYPARAISLGLEGHVVVQFDVDELGAVFNVTVLESSHSVFERAAIEAAKRAKFRPRVIDGAAVATTGVRKLYRFEIEKQ